MEEGSLDAAPVWSDVSTFDARAFRGRVDCVVAGFPCQDLSVAGRRAGLNGKRSGLFFEVVRIATDCGAWLIWLENVAGIATATASVVDEEGEQWQERAAARVVGELADLGWHAEWLTLSASDVGASHGRARWFCLAWRAMADANHDGRKGGGVPAAVGWLGQADPCRSSAAVGHTHGGQQEAVATLSGRPNTESRRSDCCVADSIGSRPQEREGWGKDHGALQPPSRPDAAGVHRALDIFAPSPADEAWGRILSSAPWLAPALSIEEQHDAHAAFEAAQSVLRGVADGVASRLDFDFRAQRLRSLGNGVVALQAAAAFVVLARRSGLQAEQAALPCAS